MRRLIPTSARRTESGTALMLMPALVLVLLVLGAIAVDLSLLHSARRSAYRSLSAAADDAAAMVDAREFQRTGDVRLDAEAARRVARAHLGVLEGPAPPGFAEPAFDVAEAAVHADAGSGRVRIEATVLVERVFASAIPGMDDTTSIPVVVTGRML